jgi:hypothetical protein
MSERRQAFRPESIEIDLGDGKVISVAPVVWTQRSDFGNEVVRQHVEIINEAVRIFVDKEFGIPQLEAKMGEKFSDPDILFKLGLTTENYEQVKDLNLYMNQIIEILLAICDVNVLPQLKALIDPNSQTPTRLGGITSELMSGIIPTQKTESGPDLSLLESVEEPSPV